MTTLTFKQSLAVLPSLTAVHELFYRCESFNGISPKLYWHALQERARDFQALDYVCLFDEKLVGMINILFFSEAAEMTMLIDPDYRAENIDKKLLKIALLKLKNYIVSEYILNTTENIPPENSRYDHAEVEMRAPEIQSISMNFTPLKLIRAYESDLELLADIHIESFENPDKNSIVQRFSETIHQSHRKVFIAENNAGEIVGKLHIREDFNRVYIHDVGIKKAFRRQGYGKALMLSWLKEHRKDYGEKPIAVEVLSDNTAALNLYQSCGFETTANYYFWRFYL